MKNETHKAGVGIAGVITLIFLVLKLTGLIDCKWSFIVAPVLIAFILRWLIPGILKVTVAGLSGVRSRLVVRVIAVITSVSTRYSTSGALISPSGSSGRSSNQTIPIPR